ncbi:MAG: D-methionine transport system permease protein MetI [Chlamydiales bacterium]|nr:D-methionine transport system permease protein MetI [Chlamydiales bacterium]
MSWIENLQLAWRLIPVELLNTVYMVLLSTVFAFLIGLPIGVTLCLADKGGLKENRWIYQTLGFLVNIGRSIPFAILIVAIIPFTRFIIGTSIGTTASIVPLTLAAAPFFARLVESALKEVGRPLIEASIVMGSTTSQVVQKILIPEALPSIVSGVTLTMVNLIGYSAMAGLVGGGGLGKVAIQYGYQRFNGFLMLVTLVILLLLVEVVQWLGNRLSKAILNKRGVR